MFGGELDHLSEDQDEDESKDSGDGSIAPLPASPAASSVKNCGSAFARAMRSAIPKTTAKPASRVRKGSSSRYIFQGLLQLQTLRSPHTPFCETNWYRARENTPAIFAEVFRGNQACLACFGRGPSDPLISELKRA